MKRLLILTTAFGALALPATADEITVMVNGRVIATGTPEDIHANAEVQEAYLGG